MLFFRYVIVFTFCRAVLSGERTPARCFCSLATAPAARRLFQSPDRERRESERERERERERWVLRETTGSPVGGDSRVQLDVFCRCACSLVFASSRCSVLFSPTRPPPTKNDKTTTKPSVKIRHFMFSWTKYLPLAPRALGVHRAVPPGSVRIATPHQYRWWVDEEDRMLGHSPDKSVSESRASKHGRHPAEECPVNLV